MSLFGYQYVCLLLLFTSIICCFGFRVCLLFFVYQYVCLLLFTSVFVVFLAYEYVCCLFCLQVNVFYYFCLPVKFAIYHRERESSCDGGVRERDVDLEKTYRYHAVTLGVLTVAFIITTLVTINEQKW